MRLRRVLQAWPSGGNGTRAYSFPRSGPNANGAGITDAVCPSHAGESAQLAVAVLVLLARTAGTRIVAAHLGQRGLAIGEIGLDYHYDYSPRDVQQAVFIRQLIIAKAVALPIVIHNRESMEDMVRILKEYFASEYGGIMHSYSGSVEMAKVFLDMGFHLSISGPLTFSNARKLPEVVAMMPLERLLIETDSPYLTPTPHRGKRNEPAYVGLVAAEIARIRGMAVEEVAEITTTNAKRVFGISEKTMAR